MFIVAIVVGVTLLVMLISLYVHFHLRDMREQRRIRDTLTELNAAFYTPISPEDEDEEDGEEYNPPLSPEDEDGAAI